MNRFYTCIRTVLPLLLLLGMVLSAWGHDFVVDGIYYNINDDGATVRVTTKNNTQSWMTYVNDVVIPETVDCDGVRYTVTAVEDSAFYGSSRLSSVTFPATISTVGNHAFAFCYSLTGITLPANLLTIGTEAFAGCWGVTDVVVDGNNHVYDSRDSCNAIIETATGTLLLGCKNTVIPSGVTAIGRSAFAWSRITSVIIPSGVTVIDDYAFDHCYYIDELSLPEGLESIGYSAFNGAYANLTSLTLPNSLVSIGDYAFSCCSGLTSIDFGHGVQRIGSNAFFNCSSLTELNLPNSLLSIGREAFLSCTGLTSVAIPASVTHIGMAAFQACENLTQITVDPASETFDSRDRCNAVIETATNTLVAGCVATVIPQTVTALDNGAFRECIGLHTIEIPASVTVIGSNTFDYCYDLDTITLPPHLTTIGNSAFAGCEKLIFMRIPDKVTHIGDSAFYDCPWMNYLTLGRGLEYIGKCAFYGTNLITLSCSAMEPPLIADEDSFWHYGDFSDAILKVPAPALQRYLNAEYWSLFPLIVADGDLTGDGRVNMDDLTAMIGCLVGYGTTSLQYFAADLNNDNRFNMDDLTSLINRLVFGPNGQLPPK